MIPFHQLDFPVQLNVRADRMAKSFLYQHMQSRIPDPSLCFSTERWAIIKDGIKLCNLDQDVLYSDITKADLISYWGHRCLMTEEVIPDVDWDSFGAAFQSCTFARQRRVMKLNSGHAPVGKMMQLWKKQDHTRCPLCDAPSEDVHYMLICCFAQATESWETALAFFENQLHDLQTDPKITEALITGLHSWRQFPERHTINPQPTHAWRVR